MKKKISKNIIYGSYLAGGCFMVGFSVGIGMGIGFTVIMCYMNSTVLGIYSFFHGIYLKLSRLNPITY